MMEYKYLFGSKMLGLSNNRDEDWIVFTDVKRAKDLPIMSYYRGIRMQNKIIQDFIDCKYVFYDPYKGFILYQCSAGFHNEEDYIFNHFNILEHKKSWIKILKALINDASIEDMSQKDKILPKRFYHIVYQYYMIKENTHWISETAKAEVQKIHDLEVPSSVFYEIREMINTLEEEEGKNNG